uniref:Titin n=1 Tax=Xiphophorus couchianus TaxID=32473 RepID=A0A3B5MIV9_9TELE
QCLCLGPGPGTMVALVSQDTMLKEGRFPQRSGSVTTRPTSLPPCSMSPDLYPRQTVQAVRGDHVTIKIPITGKPEPAVTWQKGPEVLSSSAYHQVITTRSFTSLVFLKGVQRKDTGYYAITAKNRFGSDKQTIEVNVADIPDAPKGLVVSDIARDSITLTWEPPASDGGSEIINYIVEKCPTTADRWIRAGHTTDCSITIINIFGKTKYQFRVIAENQFGLSLPSPPTEPITTKEDKSVIRNYDEEPMFKRLLANVECTEGDSVRFELRVSGVPTPSLKWEKDGLPLQFGPKVVVIEQDIDYHVLHIRETLLEDDGVYKVTATNSAGSASCQATLKPSPNSYN